jgi:hypothetical protein
MLEALFGAEVAVAPADDEVILLVDRLVDTVDLVVTVELPTWLLVLTLAEEVWDNEPELELPDALMDADNEPLEVELGAVDPPVRENGP